MPVRRLIPWLMPLVLVLGMAVSVWWLLVGNALADEPFPRTPDGRYVIEFKGLRTVLIEHMEVSLSFPGGRPEIGTPAAREYENRSYWPAQRILKEPDAFKKNLAEANSFHAWHGHLLDLGKFTPKLNREVRINDRMDIRNVFGVRVHVIAAYKEAITGGPEPYRTGAKQGRLNSLERREMALRNEGFFKGKDAIREDLDGFFVVKKQGDWPNPTEADYFLSRDKRLFPASDELIIHCDPFWCERESFARSDQAMTRVEFPLEWSRRSWPEFDRYIHEYIKTIVLEPRPEGIE